MNYMENREETLLVKYPELLEAKKYGIDVVMLYDNLERSPAERIRRHQIALDLFKTLHKSAQSK